MTLKFRCTVEKECKDRQGDIVSVPLAVVETETLIDLIHALLNVLIDMVKEEKNHDT